MGKLFTIYGIEVSILTSSDPSETYSPLAEGFDNVAEALNEVVQQYFFISEKGYATNHVTGMAPSYTLTGRRVLGDPAQEYIFGQKYNLDTSRQTTMKIEYSDEASTPVTITCPVTFCNIQEFSGASTDDSAISVELRMEGKPTAE